MKTALIAALAATTVLLGACGDDSDDDTPEPVRGVPVEDYVTLEPVAGDSATVTCRAGLLYIDGARGTSTELVANCPQAMQALRDGNENVEPAVPAPR